MREIDFNHYPKNQELIEECNVDQDRTTWFQCNKSEAAVLIAEMHQLCKLGLSLNLSLRNRSKTEVIYYYDYLSRVLHVFAIEHARQELGLSPKEVSTLFSHKGFTGLDKELFE
jgi:phosphoribosylformylglycinamidine (FGAM) synthase-like enzyme